MLKKLENKGLFVIFFTLVFFGFTAYNTPLTGDDWTWGGDIGWDRMLNGFENYNGRYLSNFIEIVITRYDSIRILLFAVCSTLLIYLTTKLHASKNDKTTYMVAFLLFMLIPTKIYAQTFGWAAGYVNYVISVVLLLAYLNIVKNIFDKQLPTYNKYWLWLVIPLGISSQLIVEHMTIFNVFTALLVILYTYSKHQKTYLLHWSYLISSLVGSVIMFTNGAYLNVLKGEDSYRTVREEIGIFERIYTTYKESMYNLIFIENSFVILIISALLVLLMLKTTTMNNWYEKYLKPFFLFVVISFNLFLLLFKKAMGTSYLGVRTADFEVIFTLLFSVVVFAIMTIFIQKSDTKIRLLYYLSGIVLLTLPFVFITPYGPRCVFGAYAFMVFIVIELLNYLRKEFDWSVRKLNICLGVSVLSYVIVFSFITHMNGHADRERLNHLYKAVEKEEKVIQITELPYPQFHWMPSPRPNMYHAKTFKMFHKVPDETEIQIIPYFQSQRKK